MFNKWMVLVVVGLLFLGRVPFALAEDDNNNLHQHLNLNDNLNLHAPRTTVYPTTPASSPEATPATDSTTSTSTGLFPGAGDNSTGGQPQ